MLNWELGVLLPPPTMPLIYCGTPESHWFSSSLSFPLHNGSRAYRGPRGCRLHRLLPNSLQLLRPGSGVAEALTWYRATLVGSWGAGRLLADPWATDLRLPPSTTLLDSLTLSMCSLWRGQAWSRVWTRLQSGACPASPVPAPPTRLLGGRWMKVSSWAVSRTRWRPRTSCHCWIPDLGEEEVQGTGMAHMSLPPPSGPLDLR